MQVEVGPQNVGHRGIFGIGGIDRLHLHRAGSPEPARPARTGKALCRNPGQQGRRFVAEDQRIGVLLVEQLQPIAPGASGIEHAAGLSPQQRQPLGHAPRRFLPDEGSRMTCQSIARNGRGRQPAGLLLRSEKLVRAIHLTAR